MISYEVVKYGRGWQQVVVKTIEDVAEVVTFGYDVTEDVEEVVVEKEVTEVKMYVAYFAQADVEVQFATQAQATWNQKREIWVANWNNQVRANQDNIRSRYGKAPIMNANRYTLIKDMVRNLASLVGR